jgi:hypothetical protein
MKYHTYLIALIVLCFISCFSHSEPIPPHEQPSEHIVSHDSENALLPYMFQKYFNKTALEKIYMSFGFVTLPIRIALITSWRTVQNELRDEDIILTSSMYRLLLLELPFIVTIVFDFYIGTLSLPLD